jgi:hypothetical protein
MACSAYFLIALNVLVAIIPLSNKSKNSGIEVKRLSVVTMWPFHPISSTKFSPHCGLATLPLF